MKKILEIILVIFFSSSLWANDISSLPTFFAKTGMVAESTQANALILPDRGKKLTVKEALHQLELGNFKPYDTTQIPDKFQRGQYVFWIYFTVFNSTSDIFPLYIKAKELVGDSVFVIENRSIIQAFEVAFPPIYDTTGLLKMPMLNGFLHLLPSQVKTSFLIRFTDYEFPTYFLPTLSDARYYEAWYHQEVKWNSLLFCIMTGMMGTVILLFGFQYLHTFDKATLWYVLYGLSMLFIGWRNLEGLNVAYYSSRFLISWTQTKVFHSAANFITYAFFIRYFFGDTAPIIKKLARIIFLVSCFFMLVEVFLLQIDWYWSWLSYQFYRNMITIFSLLALFYVWKTPHPLAKYILTGSLCLVIGEVISWAFPTNMNSQVATFGVFLEMLFFSYALGLRTSKEINEATKLKYTNQLLIKESELEKERLRTNIAQDIHDEVGATLAKISLTAQVAANLPKLSKLEISKYLSKISSDARVAAEELRDLVFGINSDYDSFEDMQAYFREKANEFWKNKTIHLSFDFEQPQEMVNISPDIRRQLLLIFKEAQTNIFKHSEANQIYFTLKLTTPYTYLLVIKDNGQGFLLENASNYSNGLKGMKRRAESINADLNIQSQQGKGCIIKVQGKIV